MGNDGGSIPTRRELVKEAARDPTTTQVKETQQEQREYQWSFCPLSHRVLAHPVVSDCSGKLYNKDTILEYLLPADDGALGYSKADYEQVLEGRVRSLRDVVEVRFNVDMGPKEEKNGRGGSMREQWLCPVTDKALGPAVKAVYLVPCGHAFSEAGLKEVLSRTCLQCDESFTPDNVIPILPTAQCDIDRLAVRGQNLKEQGLTHSLKKAPSSGKKRKKNVDPSTAGVLTPAADHNGAEKTSASQTQHPSNGTVVSNGGIKNAATASLTAKVLEEEKEKHKRRKLGGNDNLKSLFSSEHGSSGKDGDFMTRGFSIPAGAKR